MSLNIVLVEPEIPQNTGNIIRTCAACGATLHLVYPLGFSMSEKALKRAGLDYFDKASVVYHDSFNDFLEFSKDKNITLVSTKAPRDYTKKNYSKDEFIIFGKETKGLDEQYILDNFENSVRIPMREGIRSLNLSNSVAIVVYEALRQHDFSNLQINSSYFEK